ncbi:hypothetical protein Asppvi_009263 [Aspergillus pseudoviridinutans]|uniref:Uncharacterized protein n=1 Tax=Aspergillus pseudoviridinutans TaxID=1517512 RepID=A0A9P3EW13_9EURO|nr:uncharacterized protein Asppvi_009263 [Aspergillus pseudoviridinutans]GIJ90309.1 hypothetical protein Asppvi_009263 [Aspergillus pseudoviridinutans]
MFAKPKVAQFPISVSPGVYGGVDVYLGSGPFVCFSPVCSEDTWDGQNTDRNSGASYGLINGGKGGMIYTYLGGLAGFSFVILSMAEMASMYLFA